MNKHNSGNIYIWSDLHLGQGNVIRYCEWPFKDMEEMNEALLHAWKSTIRNGDAVINLGDVGLNLSKEYLTEISHQLPGYKILAMGNHDRKKPVRRRLDAGFNETYPHPVVYAGNYILSHAMAEMFTGSGFINIHGHMHNLESGIQNRINVWVEKTGYKPVLFERLVSGLEKKGRTGVKTTSK